MHTETSTCSHCDKSLVSCFDWHNSTCLVRVHASLELTQASQDGTGITESPALKFATLFDRFPISRPGFFESNARDTLDANLIEHVRLKQEHCHRRLSWKLAKS